MSVQKSSNGIVPQSDVAEVDSLPGFFTAANNVIAEESPHLRNTEPSAMELFFAWEKLRVLYNGILLGITVIWKSRGDWISWPTLLFSIVVANGLFCAGPVLENYLCWFGLPRSLVHGIIFCLLALFGLVLLGAVVALDQLAP